MRRALRFALNIGSHSGNLGSAMRPLLLLVCVLFTGYAFAAEASEKTPQPKGEPSYSRRTDGWAFGCWDYRGTNAIHGRLFGKDGEVFGKTDGEKIETGFGTLVWRGPYIPGKPSEKSTGWLFVESSSGPPNIRDRYDPKTGVLP